MRQDTVRRIKIYQERLPHIREKIGAAGLALLIAGVVAMSATFAWVTLSRAPEVAGLTTSMSANGSLEIALSKPDGSAPDEFDVDESVGISSDVTVSNLAWGNLVNLYDPSYGINGIALRPAQLEAASLLTRPLKGAVYGGDGRAVELSTDYSYVTWDPLSEKFITSSGVYGVRAIATYKLSEEASGADVQAYSEMLRQVDNAHDTVNILYADMRDHSFSQLQSLISVYAQDSIDGSNTELSRYLKNLISCFNAMLRAMEAQKEAYVALANFQLFMDAQNSGQTYTPTTWDNLVANRTKYNVGSIPDLTGLTNKYKSTNSSNTDAAVSANAEAAHTAAEKGISTHGIISLVGLTQFVSDYNKLVADLGYLNQYQSNYEAGTGHYYWGSGGASGHQVNNIVADLIDYSHMTVVESSNSELILTELGANKDKAMGLLGGEKTIKVYGGIMTRFEQLAVDGSYRLRANRPGCTISVVFGIPVSVKGVAETMGGFVKIDESNNNASVFDSSSYFSLNKLNTEDATSLIPTDMEAEDTYGLVVDLWLRTNTESTKLTLEPATAKSEDGTIVRYDGINRVWGSTEEAELLPSGSTTQGGGSCYVYYADTPEDMQRSLDLLSAMKVAFVDETGHLMAVGEMDTANYFAANGRITVPMLLDSTNSHTTYSVTNASGEVVEARAITTMYADVPLRLTAIMYLDGAFLNNNMVLAAAEIEGQLNLQFGSSVQLTTVGNMDLMDDVRTVTASATVTEMDYDNAISDADLTTDVLVSVLGVDPDTMTAFFVREINSQQGSREEEMTFTKQSGGEWLSSYTFMTPGVYHLRHIRLNGIDYPLEQPVDIEVKGFVVSEVSWGESEDSVSISTSDASYSETVSVKFAANDRSKMPAKVNARFVRQDGNQVDVPLAYTASSGGRWIGKTTFTGSGEYVLSYLIFDGRYKDLRALGLHKTLNLKLGLYARVTNAGGALSHRYDPEEAQTGVYNKDVIVQIFDNSGQELQNLTGARLYYSNGGSATNTINTDLTWDEGNRYYVGTLPIVRPGRYTYAYVRGEGNYITRAYESPVYAIISPDPPTYKVDESKSTYHDTIQFAPLTNDAVMDHLVIAHSESALVTAVVHNSVTGKTYELDSESGGMIYTDNGWLLKLPTYTLDIDEQGAPLPNAKYTQEGEWKLLAVYISDCFDENSNQRTAENPIIWIGSDELSRQYASTAEISGATKDFSKLSTTVSCTVKVTMQPGTTALGSVSTPFFAPFSVSDVGMSVLVTDENDNVIPASKIGDVKLNLNYVAPTATAEYGYKVLAGANTSYVVSLNSQDPDTGRRTVSEVNGASDYDWHYVGTYNVNNLQVTIGNTTLSYQKNNAAAGVPEKYTITTAAPTAENVTVPSENITGPTAVLGKAGNNITGTFLQAQNPNVNARIKLETPDGSNAQYVNMDGLTMQLVMTYQDGKNAPNGGYSWTGTSQYETVTINMTNNSGVFSTSASPLLAGTYSARIICNVGEDSISRNLNDVSVYSSSPTLSVKGVTPSMGNPFEINTYTGENAHNWDNRMAVSVENYYSSEYANVYIKASEGNAYYDGNLIDDISIVDYTLPTVSLELGNIGSQIQACQSITASIPNNDANSFFDFSDGKRVSSCSIGRITSSTFKYMVTGSTCGSTEVDVPYEVPHTIGEQEIHFINVQETNGAVFTVDTNTITIRETNSAPPKISFIAIEGYETPQEHVSHDGGPFSFVLPSSIGTTTGEYDKTDESVDWREVSRATKGLTFLVSKSVTKIADYNKPTCGSTTYAQAQGTYVFHKYDRTTLVETKTSSVQRYRAEFGVTGWVVNGVRFDPGESITISSVVTDRPIIDVISENPIGSASVQTTMRTTISDEDMGLATTTFKTSSSSKYTDYNTAKKEAEEKYKDNLPSGYTWFDANNHQADLHYDVPQVETAISLS